MDTVAYSYVRFSTPDQARGDSLRRQTEAAADWCRRNDVQLDSATTLHDLGRSAFTGSHRKNPDRHALAAFLKLVEAGRVPRGSYLVVEALDRLTREDIQPALLLILNLMQAGVRIVQLKPAEMVFDDKSDTLPVMMMIVELARGHSESAMKSQRNGQAWVEKRRKARESGEVMTRCLPAWVEMRDGALALIPDRAAVVKRIYRLAAGGYGQQLTAKLLIAEGVPPFGRPLTEEDLGRWAERRADKGKPPPTGKEAAAFRKRLGELGRWEGDEWVKAHWNSAYVGALIRDRRAAGEFQARRRRGKEKIGDPIVNYYPPAVSDAEWHAARAGAVQRRNKRGRVGRYVNVFAGLLRDARDGGTYCVTTRPPSTGGRRRVLLNSAAHQGRTSCNSFPFPVFEAAIIQALAEIEPHEILNGDGEPDETMTLAGALAAEETKIAELEAELLHGDVPSLARVLRQRETRKAELAEKLATARRKAAHPVGEAWGEAKTLMGAVESAQDPYDARLRLRSALRRMIGEVWMLVVPRGHVRLCAVQIWFTDNKKHRDYLIQHRPAKANQWHRNESEWCARSMASSAIPAYDLRLRDHAEMLEADVRALDLSLFRPAPEL